MKTPREIHVPPMSAKAFTVAPGQTVRIIDLEGKQGGDFVAFSAEDVSIRFSQARTRIETGRVRLTRGHALWTNTFPPRVMFTITGDTCGVHDLLYPPCCRYALEKRFGVVRDGCLENLVGALTPWHIAARDIPDPLNIFCHIVVTDAGGMEFREPPSKPGDFVDLKAEMNCLVAVATCAAPRPGKTNSAFLIRIIDS